MRQRQRKREREKEREAMVRAELPTNIAISAMPLKFTEVNGWSYY